jgi:adenine-specific DNA-methyltransferase
MTAPILTCCYGVLLDWGVPLSLPNITENIDGKNVPLCKRYRSSGCFEEHVPEEVIREIARRKPFAGGVPRQLVPQQSGQDQRDRDIQDTFSETTIKVI